MENSKLLKFIILASIISLSMQGFVLSENFGRIEGKVFDVSSGKPVPGAQIIVEGTELSATTNEDGSFSILSVPAGEYHIRISSANYLDLTQKVRVRVDKVTSVNFEIRKVGMHREEIVVTATKTKHLLEDVPVPTVVINKTEIEKANIQSVQHALRYLSGIQVNESYGWGDKGKIEFMGFDDKHTLVLIDGRRVFGGHGDSVDLQSYPIDMIERIEVVKSAGSALYGSDAMGGIINLITKTNHDKDSIIKFSPSFGTRNRQTYKLSHGYKIGDFNYILGYTYNYSDGINPETDQFDENSAYASFSYQLTPDAILTLKPFYSYQTMKESDRKQERFCLASRFEWNPDPASTLMLDISLFNYDNRWQDDERGEIGYKDELYEMELSYNRFLFDSHSLTIGYHLQGMKLDNNNIDVVADQKTHSLFLQDEMFYNPFTVVLGVRIDNHDLWGSEINPKASLLIELTKDIRFRGSIGRGFRGPSLTKLYGDGWRMGPYIVSNNPDLEPETSIGYQASAEWILTSNLMVEASWFLNNIDNLIEARYSNVGPPPWSMDWENIAEVRTQGIELNVTTMISNNLKFKLGYTLLDTQNLETGLELPYKANNSLNFRMDWGFPSIGLDFVIDGRYIGKRYWDSDNEEELDDYTLVNLSVSKIIADSFQIFVRVDNLLGVEEIEDSYCIDGTEVLAGFRLNL